MSDVFVSYSSNDRAFAERLIAELRARGFDVYEDPRGVEARVIDQDVVDAAEAAKSVLVVWSSHSRNSPWVKSEALMGLGASKLVAIRIDEHIPPEPFRTVAAIDFRDFKDGRPGRGLEHLLHDLQAMVDSGATPATAPLPGAIEPEIPSTDLIAPADPPIVEPLVMPALTPVESTAAAVGLTAAVGPSAEAVESTAAVGLPAEAVKSTAAVGPSAAAVEVAAAAGPSAGAVESTAAVGPSAEAVESTAAVGPSAETIEVAVAGASAGAMESTAAVGPSAEAVEVAAMGPPAEAVESTAAVGPSAEAVESTAAAGLSAAAVESTAAVGPSAEAVLSAGAVESSAGAVESTAAVGPNAEMSGASAAGSLSGMSAGAVWAEIFESSMAVGGFAMLNLGLYQLYSGRCEPIGILVGLSIAFSLTALTAMMYTTASQAKFGRVVQLWRPVRVIWAILFYVAGAGAGIALTKSYDDVPSGVTMGAMTGTASLLILNLLFAFLVMLFARPPRET